jgi:hypothetical protein
MGKLVSVSLDQKFSNVFERARKGELGLHDQMLSVAVILKNKGYPPAEAIKLMHQASELVERRSARPGEIEQVVGYVWKSPSFGTGTFKKKRSPSERNEVVIETWASRGKLEQLTSATDPIPATCAEIMKELFRPEDLIFLSDTVFSKDIQSLENAIQRDLSKVQYVCPATFKDPDGGRTNDNVAGRRYEVWETDDDLNFDEQVGLIIRLSQELPIKMAVKSANRSIHAWFRSAFASTEQIEKFHDLVITLGGDPAVLRSAQCVRAPWGVNDKNGKDQQVIFWNKN